MKERPILFSAPMVRAILDGAKTQTRRIVKPQPEFRHGCFFNPGDSTGYGPGLFISNCRYGQPRDRLWVRETFVCDDYRYPNGPIDELKEELFYRADDENPFEAPEGKFWKPSIHMPRWASRINLEITGVRVERLRDISEEDAQAEGAQPSLVGADLDYLKYRAGYQTLWESINGDGSWEVNPWVWIVEFQRVEQPALLAAA
jgi:hypothetical protein